MPSGILVIGDREREKIAQLIASARAKPVPADIIARIGLKDFSPQLKLSDRPPGFSRPPSQMIQLGTYTVAFSFEQQPPGLMRHLSVSSAHRGKVPSLKVMVLIAEEFGFSRQVLEWLDIIERSGPEKRKPFPGRFWLEEFEPGHHAVNLIERVER